MAETPCRVRRVVVRGNSHTHDSVVRQELLGLKARYKAIAGEEYNAKPKRRLEPTERADRGGEPPGRQVADVVVGPVEVLGAVEARRPDLVFARVDELRVLKGVVLEGYDGAGDRLFVELDLVLGLFLVLAQLGQDLGLERGQLGLLGAVLVEVLHPGGGLARRDQVAVALEPHVGWWIVRVDDQHGRVQGDLAAPDPEEVVGLARPRSQPSETEPHHTQSHMWPIWQDSVIACGFAVGDAAERHGQSR